MNTHAVKTQENKSQSATNGTAQKKGGDESTFQFMDNRPEAVAQRKLQEMANNSPQAMQLKAFQDMANNSAQVKQAAQLQAMADNFTEQLQQPIQKKESHTDLPENRKSGLVIQRVGEVPDGYNQVLKNMMSDGRRIESRMHDMELVRADDAKRSFVPQEIWQKLDSSNQRKCDLIEEWKDYNGEMTENLQSNIDRMDRIFTGIVAIWNVYNPTAFKDIYRLELRTDGRVVEGRDLWNHILSLPATTGKTKAQFTAHITAEIAKWNLPKLSKWYEAIGFPAGGSHIRIDENVHNVRGVSTHLTLYMTNVDGTSAITTATDTIMDELFPASTGDHKGIHVTPSLYGNKNERNPHYFKGEGYWAKFPADVGTWLADKNFDSAALAVDMGKALTAKFLNYRQKIDAFKLSRTSDTV